MDGLTQVCPPAEVTEIESLLQSHISVEYGTSQRPRPLFPFCYSQCPSISVKVKVGSLIYTSSFGGISVFWEGTVFVHQHDRNCVLSSRGAYQVANREFKFLKALLNLFKSLHCADKAKLLYELTQSEQTSGICAAVTELEL